MGGSAAFRWGLVSEGPLAATGGVGGGGDPWLWAFTAAVVVALVGIGVGVVWYRRGRADGSTPGGSAGEDDPRPEGADRIEALLHEHDGRLHQSALVDETGWSKAKVSMLLSDMEEADRIRKLRVGRENIISLPGREPEATRSPDDR